MPTQTFHLNPNQPYDVLREVIYEISMLIGTSTEVGKNDCTKNALLESRLLHTRNLIAFFEKPKRSLRLKDKNNRIENDDVLSLDYGFSPRKVAISQRNKKRLNKALAHITYERIEYRSQNQMDWSFTTTLLPILVTCEEFLQHLNNNFLKPEDSEIKEELTHLLKHTKDLIEAIKQLPSGI